MKTTNKIYFLWVGLIALTSCINELEVEPGDPDAFLAEDFYADADSYKQSLAGVYGNLSLVGANGPDESNISGLDAGTSQYIRGLWNLQELTTDEAVWTWENDPGTRELNRTIWNADNSIIRGMYGRAMAGVAFANEFLRESTDDLLDARGVDESLRQEISVFRAEARLIRALSYYHIMDLFGKAPFVTENDAVGAFQAPEINRTELFEFIESELLEIEPILVEPLQNETGRVDKAASWMLLAKIYLNAEVYTGENRYSDCLEYCQQIIDSPYQLSANYLYDFMADNNTSEARNEIIISVQSDGVVTQNWGTTTMLVNGQIGGLESNGEDFGVNAGGWGGALRVTNSFSEILTNGLYDSDDRNTLIIGERPIEVTSVSNSGTGYILGKYSNITSLGEPGPSNTFVSANFPMFRLADVYLMYAEAHLRGGGGTVTQALELVNDLRARANNTNALTSADLTLDNIFNERTVELYWEAHRRQDLIRFNRFSSGSYNWNWKGNFVAGIAIDDNMEVFPIPNASLAANTNLTQNEGY